MKAKSKLPRVTIVDSGRANIASVSAALRRAGAEVAIAGAAGDLSDAEFLVLPGVGSFGAAMQFWDDHDLVIPIREAILSGLPTLAICLGMQLLCRSSEESVGIEGLHIFDCAVRSFGHDLPIPHLGWNKVEVSDAEGSQVEVAANQIVKSGFAYFAHSFRLVDAPSAAKVSIANYDGPFIASIEVGNILGCQFHPELSGRWGSELIQTWLDQEKQVC